MLVIYVILKTYLCVKKILEVSKNLLEKLTLVLFKSFRLSLEVLFVLCIEIRLNL